MNGPAAIMTTELWPLAVYLGVVLFLTGSLLVLSYFLGQRHREAETDKPYESGIISTGTARVRFDIKFYQNAIFFVIFDLEVMFIISWAVAIREAGWSGYIEIVIFIGVLAAALAYLWRQGALDWGPQPRETDSGQEESGGRS
ncbi:MAG: NADH-quinone oxidoreductase subunit A [Actinobacteria bacterium]|nr:NADH-quinone oxidoreductase subunit A [Actinomycetota bacterium]